MGAKQKGTAESSSVSRAPQYVRGSQRAALNAANTQFSQGPNADQSAALEMIRQRATAGNPLLGQAQGALGEMLNGGPNPYLDRMFNQAADATASRFKGEFAGAGRDIGAAAPFREAELTNLATNIYGGAYDADQNRRLAAIGAAPGLAGADYADANALLQAGGFDQAQLNNYINQIVALRGQYGTNSTSQPIYGNPLATALGIIAAPATGGASLGMAFNSMGGSTGGANGGGVAPGMNYAGGG